MFWALALIAAFFSSYCLSAKFNCKDCVEYIPEVPLRMYSSYHVYGVTSVDSTKQTFGLDIEVQLKWNDSRIEFRESEWKPSFEKAKKRIWLPHFHVWQELNKQEILKIKLIKVNENITTVQMKSHLQIDVGCSMNFIDFPNDRQNCYFVMYDEDYNITEIIMETVVTSAKKFFHSFSNTNITVTPGDFTPYSNVSITGRETNEKNRMKRVLFKKRCSISSFRSKPNDYKKSSALLLELLSSINGSCIDTILGLYRSSQSYPRKNHFTHYHCPSSNGSFKRCTSKYSNELPVMSFDYIIPYICCRAWFQLKRLLNWYVSWDAASSLFCLHCLNIVFSC